MVMDKLKSAHDIAACLEIFGPTLTLHESQADADLVERAMGGRSSKDALKEAWRWFPVCW